MSLFSASASSFSSPFGFLIRASFLRMDELLHMYYAVESTLRVQAIKNFWMLERNYGTVAVVAAVTAVAKKPQHFFNSKMLIESQVSVIGRMYTHRIEVMLV